MEGRIVEGEDGRSWKIGDEIMEEVEVLVRVV